MIGLKIYSKVLSYGFQKISDLNQSAFIWDGLEIAYCLLSTAHCLLLIVSLTSPPFF